MTHGQESYEAYYVGFSVAPFAELAQSIRDDWESGKRPNSDENIRRSLAKAMDSGRWMIAVAWIDREHEVSLEITTNNYPLGRFTKTYEMIKSDLLEIKNKSS